MSQKRFPWFWIVLVSLPSTYLLVAGSNQFHDYSPLEVWIDHWYVGLVITGALSYPLFAHAGGVRYALPTTLAVNLGGYVVSYFVVIWRLWDYDLAVLSLNTLIQPIVLYVAFGVLFLAIGYTVGGVIYHRWGLS